MSTSINKMYNKLKHITKQTNYIPKNRGRAVMFADKTKYCRNRLKADKYDYDDYDEI